MVTHIIVVLIIIKHQTKLITQLELMFLIMVEFMPLLPHLIVKVLYELLGLLLLMVINIEYIKFVEST